MLETLLPIVEKQLLFNRKKNLFCEPELSNFGFSPVVFAFIRENSAALKNVSNLEVETLADSLVNKAIEALCQANQFYYFNSFDRTALKKVYLKLLHEIKQLPAGEEEDALASLAPRHYRALQRWLRSSNPFARTLYSTAEPYLKQEVVCGEYAAQTQLKVLNIDPGKILEPVLDLGCGQQAFLVNHLRKLGREAFGIDRNVTPDEFLFQADWFEFDLIPGKWGTIISNLGFSNHFQHHHLRVNGDYAKYGQRYMEILNALKPGGTFYYAPDLPFIETYLDPSEFKLEKTAIEGTDYYASCITKTCA
ncbi:class I SAM-dependent methyltransferase [Adhaeribacter soli]|uniref:Class I SAM-dependent methyltransferase n=1 Tax=Adhaeribacter soli TaxID=2607655 RepID=A0A5N1IML0_9BACT|nr:class I SAM-dependent methyltransferase [Adhaeribacter soli]KAA9325157.1 class I SAM-dependent methyltransferase [Adhaeribacter soli]